MTRPTKAAEFRDVESRLIYRLGGVAALAAALVFRRNLAEEFLLFRGLGVIHSGPTAFPANAVEWFALLHDHCLIGLTFLNLFDLVNYALVGLIFLGLYASLKSTNKSVITLALLLALVGIANYFASNQAFAMLSLSSQYAATTTESQRTALLAAGEALMAIHNTSANYGNGLYLSFFLVNVSGLIFAVVMRGSEIFGKAAAISGILANIFALGYYVTLIFTPKLSAIPLSVAAPFLLVWYLLIGRTLLQLAANKSSYGSRRQ